MVVRIGNGVYVPPSQPAGGGGGGPINPDFNATGAKPTYVFPSSVYAQTVGASPIIKANSSTLVSNLNSQITTEFGTVNANDGTHRYVVHGQQIGTFTNVSVNPGDRWSGPQGTLPTPLLTAMTATTGSDHELCVWDVDNHTVGSYTGPITYNYWVFNPWGTCNVEQMAPSDGSYAGFGAWGQDSLTTGTTTASGSPYIATLITYAEWLYGTIGHVLGLTQGNPTFFTVNPAIASDGSSINIGDGKSVPYGTLFIMPSTVTMPDFAAAGSSSPKLAQQVFTALQNYGMMAIDQTAGNGCDIGLEGIGPWTAFNSNITGNGVDWMSNLSTAYNAFKGMPWSSLEVAVPANLVGSGGGGSSAIRGSGTTIAQAATSPGTITIPSTTQTNDTLVLFVLFNGQGFNDAAPTGWSYLGGQQKAGNFLAVYTRTAQAGDASSTFNMNFAGSAMTWCITDVSGSTTGATFVAGYEGYENFVTSKATLTSGQNLTLIFGGVQANSTAAYSPDGTTQVAWTSGTPWSVGLYQFPGAAYADGFAFNDYTNCLGVSVAV